MSLNHLIANYASFEGLCKKPQNTSASLSQRHSIGAIGIGSDRHLKNPLGKTFRVIETSGADSNEYLGIEAGDWFSLATDDKGIYLHLKTADAIALIHSRKIIG
jgi:hypothetical protein